MRILYLTTESYSEPIVQSQVVNLLERIASYRDIKGITLVTFNVEGGVRPGPLLSAGAITHVPMKDRGTLRNILASVYYAMTKGRAYDIVHVRSYLPMFAGVLAKMLLRKKLLFDPRGLFAEEQSYFARRSVVTFAFKQLERLFCAVSDSIVVVSEPFKEHFVERYALPPHRLSVVSTFSSEYRNDTSSPESLDLRKELGWQDATIFVYSGSLGQWQMVDEVVAFFARVSARLSNARFLFLTLPAPELLALLAARLPDDSYALRRVPSKALSALLSQCDFGVLFRADHIVNRVSAPIKVKDYLIAGLPIVISDGVGDSSDFVRRHEFGVVLRNLSEDEMTRAIDAILAARGNWDRQHIASVSRAAFDIAPVSETYHRLYLALSPRG